MSIVSSVEEIRAWAQEKICSQVKLKVPSGKKKDDATYPYKLVEPAAFSLFVPAQERLPPNVEAPIPSLCVRVIEGTDTLPSCERVLQMQFWLSAWNPGNHSKDIFVPDESHPGYYHLLDDPDYFKLTGDGWQDIWNFLDVALRELESTTHISGLPLVHKGGIKFGPFTDRESIPDYYPFWFAWIEFQVAEPLLRKNNLYDDL